MTLAEIFSSKTKILPYPESLSKFEISNRGSIFKRWKSHNDAPIAAVCGRNRSRQSDLSSRIVSRRQKNARTQKCSRERKKLSEVTCIISNRILQVDLFLIVTSSSTLDSLAKFSSIFVSSTHVSLALMSSCSGFCLGFTTKDTTKKFTM